MIELTCQAVEERIEAVAAGDEPAGDAFRAHIEGCVRCASALARARRVEEALASRPVPVAPARFSALVVSRIRRENWRSEQQVDWMFNVAVAAGLVAIAGGALALLNLSNVTEAIGTGVSAIIALATQPDTRVASRIAPGLSTYLLGGGFLASTLLVWSWAERSGRRS